MWHDRRGKAILKLGMWLIFFVIMAFAVFLTNLLSEPSSPSINDDSLIPHQKKFLNLKDTWELFLSSNYHYQYEIHNKNTNEMTIFQGEKTNGIDIGYRESKIGIIKYRQEDNHTYQILVDHEEEIPFIYEEEDQNYLNLQNLNTKLSYLIPDEKISGTMRKITYQNGEEWIEITTTENNIKQIRINNSQKEYNLSFTTKNEVESKK